MNEPAISRSIWGGGRIRRPIFALLHVTATLFLYGIFIVALLLVLGPCPANSAPPSTVVMVLLGSLAAIVAGARVWLEVKRLHDLDWSGWWAFPALAVPIGIGAGLSFLSEERSFAWLPSSVIIAWFLLLALKPGASGANRFGEAPTSGFRLVTRGRPSAPPL